LAEVVLKQLTKRFGKVEAVSSVSLRIIDGEFLVLLGPSGCGKSTILRLVAGLEDADSGEITIGDRLVNFVDPVKRNVAMVFQNYALYPHMTVYKNIAFPLQMARKPKGAIDTAVRRAATVLSLDELLDRLPEQLSGGQRQRVALARAIVREPEVFLMDEPLSNLDAQLRLQTRLELVRLHQQFGITTAYVTHDQVEAMTMGHRIAVMKDGVLQQIGTPREVYGRPANVFVATFLGAPPMNLVPGTIARDGASYQFRREGVALSLAPAAMRLPDAALEPACEGTAQLGIRPEHLRLGAPGEVGIAGTIAMLEPVGSDLYVAVDIGDGSTLQVRTDPDTAVATGDNVTLTFDPARLHVFAADGASVRMDVPTPAAPVAPSLTPTV
jgi:multiple sugar transport system ATP-binding protein